MGSMERVEEYREETGAVVLYAIFPIVGIAIYAIVSVVIHIFK